MPSSVRTIGAGEIRPVAETRFWSIQLLRIVAAYGVVLSHYLMARLGGRSVMNGVDIFFLISGFLVAVITDRVSPTPLQFFAHRMSRLAPLYWAAMALQLALLIAFPAITVHQDVSFRHVLLSVLFAPHLDTYGGIWPFISQGWTLNLDVFYYVVFAFSLAFSRRSRLVAVTAALVSLAVLGALVRPWHNGVVTWTYTNPLAVAFAGGMWIAEAWLRRMLTSRALGVALILLGVAIYTLQTASGRPYAASAIYVWIAASASLLTGMLCLEGSGLKLDMPVVRTLADWTYAIYLFHQLVRLVAQAVLPHQATLKFVALVAGSTLAGKFGYEWVELPVNRWLRRFETRRGAPVNRAAHAPISRTADFEDVAP